MDLLYEPLKYYDQVGKATHEDNCKQLFEKLVKQSGVNAQENKDTVKEYKHQLSIIEKVGKTISRNKTFRILSIILVVIAILELPQRITKATVPLRSIRVIP